MRWNLIPTVTNGSPKKSSENMFQPLINRLAKTRRLCRTFLCILPDNPCANVVPVTVPHDAPRWLNRNEQNALVRVVRNHRNLRELTIITLLLHTGIRVQELCDLRVQDVQLSDRKGKLIIQNGKGSKYREVP